MATQLILENSVSGNKRQAGFTLPELLISISLMGIIGVVFIGIASNFFVVIMRNEALSEMTINSQNLLRTTVENIRYGDGVRQTNQNADPNAPTGGWSTSNTSFVIIIPVPAVDSSHSYIINPSTGSPYMNELVYYKNGTTLMERRLANTNAVGDTMLTTCPANLSSNSCPPDLQLATYVSSMTFTLYDQNAAITTTPSLAQSVGITLNMQRNAPGNPINLTTNIRVTLRNSF